MDIQKEREAFEAWLKSLNENGRTTYFLGQESTVAWEAWQAAKAQAVPEGFVLVEKLQLAQLMADMDYMGKKALGSDYVSFADIAMVLDEAIEAQEQGHDS